MKRNAVLLQMVLMLSMLVNSYAYAETLQKVTINGKTLDKIDDIVMEVTGTHTIIKKSFLKFMKDSLGTFKFIVNWSDANLDGSDVKLNESKSYATGHAAGKTNTGIHPVVGKKRTDDGKLVVVFPSTISSGNEQLFINSLKISGNVDNHSITNEGYKYHSAVNNLTNLYISDSASGLLPDGYSGHEIFAITYFIANGGKRPGFSQEYDAYLCLFDPETKQSKVHELGIMKGSFPSVRVVAGDFDNDGKENELAVIRDGREANYYMAVYRVSGLEIGNAIYSASLGARENTDADNSDGCDIVAGDFNNDGKTEIAAIYADFKDTSSFANPGGDYYPTITILSWNGSSFTQKSNTDKNGDLHLGSTHWTSSSYVPHFGLIAEAEDIDGNGTDDIVLLTVSYGLNEGNIVASVWGTDSKLNPSMKCHKKTSKKIAGYGGVWPADPAECSYLPRSVSLGLVPLGDKSNGADVCRIIVTKSQGGDDSVKDSSDYRYGDEIFYMTVTNSKGSVSSLSDLTLWKSGSRGYATAIVPGDFYTECVELGEPTRMVYAADRSYAAEIQTPPYHVDYVKPDFEVNGSVPQDKMILNMSYMGSSVTYKSTAAESSKTDVAFNSTSTLDFGVSAQASAKVKLITAEASGGYKDTSTRVESTANTNEAKTALTIKDTYKGTDSLILYETDRYVWRYPVLSYADKPDNENLNGDVFMTFSLCDAPVITHGVSGQSCQFDDYQPVHEEGNLFSYPTKIENIPYYQSRQADLTQETGTHIGSKTEGVSEMTLSLSTATSDVSGLTTKSKKAVNGSLTLAIGAPKVAGAASGTVNYSRELTNTESFTKTYSQSDEFVVTINNNPLLFSSSYIQHKIVSKLYSDAAGVMKVGFAVDLKSAGENALVWRNMGMYGTKPDISLVLPARFDRTASISYNNTIIKWTANKDRISATQLRGIHFIDEDGSYTTSSLVKGKKYTVQLPVYNASFKAPDEPVKIEMRLRRIVDNDETHDTDYGQLDTQIFTIGGWMQDTENNKATVSFDCEIPESITQGNYDLYFVIDPEKLIDELHEEWNAETDPAGNNVGHYPIAVLDNEPPVYTTAYHAPISAASVSENNFRLLFEPVRSDDTRTELTFDEFRKEAVSQTEEFRAYARIVYSGSEILTNQYLNVTRITSDGTRERIAFKTIPAIFPNSERKVSFMVSPSILRNSTFNVDIVGDRVNLHWSNEAGSEPEPMNNVSSSSGGCDIGINALFALSLLALFYLRAKKHC